MSEFPNKWWSKQAVEKPKRNRHSEQTHMGQTVTTKSRTKENVDLVNDLVLSQEDTPQTHRTVREISRETGIWLRCYKITTASLYSCLLLKHSVICKKINKFEH